MENKEKVSKKGEKLHHYTRRFMVMHPDFKGKFKPLLNGISKMNGNVTINRNDLRKETINNDEIKQDDKGNYYFEFIFSSERVKKRYKQDKDDERMRKEILWLIDNFSDDEISKMRQLWNRGISLGVSIAKIKANTKEGRKEVERLKKDYAKLSSETSEKLKENTKLLYETMTGKSVND